MSLSAFALEFWRGFLFCLELDALTLNTKLVSFEEYPG